MAKKIYAKYEEVVESGIFPLDKPYKYGVGEDEKEYTALEFPLSKMTGQHIRTAQRNFEMIEGAVKSVPELNKNYLAHVAAALLKQPPDFVFDLPASDFQRITLFVQDFLLKGES